MKNEPSHEIIALQTLSSKKHAQSSSGARCLIFGQTLRLLPYFMCANSEGSGETAQARLSLSLVANVVSTIILRAGSIFCNHSLPTIDSSKAVVSNRQKYVQFVLANSFGGLSLPRNSVCRLIDHARHDLDSADWAVNPPQSSVI